jgi:predicted dehydrogenase
MEIAVPAAEAGCHVFIEKPISHSMDRVSEFQLAVDKGGGQVLVGFQFRFHPGLAAILELLEDRAIGDPISGRVHWGEYLPDWHPWEDYRTAYSARSDLGGGVVLTLCHPFDYLRWLFGEVRMVSAVVSQSGTLDLDVEDNAEIILNFEAGPLTSVHLDYNQRPPAHELEIIGSQGTISWNGINGVVRWWSTRSESWREILPPKDFERNTLFLAEMKHFLEVMSGVASPICTLNDGIQTLEIALAIHQSSKQRSTVSLVDKLA